jgi:hypothetical protein
MIVPPQLLHQKRLHRPTRQNSTWFCVWKFLPFQKFVHQVSMPREVSFLRTIEIACLPRENSTNLQQLVAIHLHRMAEVCRRLHRMVLLLMCPRRKELVLITRRRLERRLPRCLESSIYQSVSGVGLLKFLVYAFIAFTWNLSQLQPPPTIPLPVGEVPVTLLTRIALRHWLPIVFPVAVHQPLSQKRMKNVT